jgi:hypothetical protein
MDVGAALEEDMDTADHRDEPLCHELSGSGLAFDPSHQVSERHAAPLTLIARLIE